MNIIDKIVMEISPEKGYKRMQNKARALTMAGQVRKYEAAADGRRHAGWRYQNQSVNKLIGEGLKTMVDRSRDLTRNNAYASSAPGMIANNIIGTGIIPTPYIKEIVENGKIKKVPNADEFIKAFKVSWKDWAEKLNCDWDGMNTFYGLQILVVKTMIISGEVLIIKKSVPESVNPYGLQLMVLEADFIDTSKDTNEGASLIVNGIKYDKEGKKVSYFIFDKHPADGGEKSVEVPAADVIHLFDVDRPGQNRGVPLSASTTLKQRDLDDYEDAELLAKKTQACLAGFITNADPEADSGNNEPIENIEPGAMYYLNQGEQVSFTSPPGSAGFEGFVKTNLQAIAKGYKLTYEQFTGDYSNVNFSSGRMGWIEFSRQVAYWQYLVFIPRFCDMVFEWFLQRYKIKNGSAIDNVEFGANWTAPRREMIDPVKETNGKKEAIKGGLITLSEAIRQDGYNPDEVFSEIEAERKLFAEKGLVFDTVATPAAPAAPVEK